MRALLLLPLAACGRLGFDVATDATTDASTAYPELVLASNPHSYFRLAETSGAVAIDATGNGHHGTISLSGGSIGYSLPGALELDSAMRFEGDGNAGAGREASVGFPSDPAVWDGDFTVEVFVLPHQLPPFGWNNAIFVCETYMVDGFRFGWDEESRLVLWTEEAGAGAGAALRSPEVLSYSAFTHLALVRNGGSFSIYSAGQLVATSALEYFPATAGAECGFGSFHGLPSDATFDELAIYDRALTPAELASHFAGR